MAPPTGTEFVATYAKQGLPAWEAAAIAIARQDGLTPWAWSNLILADSQGNTATLRVMTDVISIGPTNDFLRLPLTPGAAQSICNLHGWLMPTPWLVYQMFHQSDLKTRRIALPNLGASLAQYANHSQLVSAELTKAGMTGPTDPRFRAAGIKKSVVISNIYQPKKVVIFGWYDPTPDAWPSNGIPYPDSRRQPIQPNSNEHGDFYVDYSHGICPVGAEAVVNGQKMATVDLYQHPVLSALVSKEGPIKVPRYPAAVAPLPSVPGVSLSTPGSARQVDVVPTIPSVSNQGLDAVEMGKRS